MSQAGSTKGTAISCEDMRNCFFGDYVDSSKDPEERTYAEVVDVPALITTMEGYLVDHNGQPRFQPPWKSLLCSLLYIWAPDLE